MQGENTQAASDSRNQVLTQLVVRVQEGCRRAETELYLALKNDVARAAKRHANTPFDAEDLGSDIWELLLCKLRGRQVRKPDAVLGFVPSVARRLAANHRRRMANQVLHATEIVEGCVEADAPGPERLTESAQSIRHVVEAIEQLPVARDREVLRHVLLLQTPAEEIAEVLGLTREHLPKVVSRAKVRLRGVLASRLSSEHELSPGQAAAVVQY